MLLREGRPTGLDHAVDALVDAALRRLVHRSGPRARPIAEAAARTAIGGKRFRPRLVLESYLAFGGERPPPDAVAAVAAGFELLHTAFVIHDDVIDRDVVRRGRPNVAGSFCERAASAGAGAAAATRFGEAAAILAGDILLYEATRVIAGARVPAATMDGLLDLLDQAVLTSAAGELADVEHATLPEAPSPDAVLAAARDKTAVYSFSAPLQAGALLAGGGEPALEPLAAAGESLGLAFQLVDDLIGAFGTVEQAGRAPGGDLREGRQTVLIALARRGDRWTDVAAALAAAGDGDRGLATVQDALAASGARAEVERLVDRTLAQAQERWSRHPLPEAVEAMLARLAHGIRGRMP
ncbi:polyprenyl synthetase family protein [Glycomyces sp. A-F 0318]|uniref:polyprenyl synthetase family protein n=1 Tax=Glycomyces amatae TaxID=2881355 RepID=UPI001E2D58D6|nr:polyprenyl synthetase family protein [Glycomyces amatae]MCD0443172.1 polyprenyl synthetase family protein [Glycomyces amatae]